MSLVGIGRFAGGLKVKHMEELTIIKHPVIPYISIWIAQSHVGILLTSPQSSQ
jgi:hypothetical protein